MLQRALPAGFIAPLRQTEIHFILTSKMQTSDHDQFRVSIAEGATMIDVETALTNCRALINQINAGLSAKEPFVDVSSATELLFYLELAASALKRSVSRSREREETKIAPNYN
jgi:hypothetical protein